MFLNWKQRSRALTTIVGRAEQRYELSFGKEFVTVFDDLMGSANQIEIMFVQKFVYNLETNNKTNIPIDWLIDQRKIYAGTHLGTKRKTDASIVLAPSHRIFIRIGPQEIAKQSLIGNVCRPHNSPDLLHRLQIGTES